MKKKKIDSMSELDLNILSSIEKNTITDQRKLSQILNTSLGKVNYCLRALIEVGLIKIENFSNSEKKINYVYILTPKGIKAKVKLTNHFLKKKLDEYEKLKEML
ncbi:MarR family EPS-associated transcriptional regulator [Gammaproteobacteria bacterium]|jgi:EPS-associated MarR family transcriptional regulator|nr:MarR family EPS-associated transcriptional regulator [Gammaproteobacteria bacterium]